MASNLERRVAALQARMLTVSTMVVVDKNDVVRLRVGKLASGEYGVEKFDA